MLKKIQVSELTLGMHIHKFCGPLSDDPFWTEQLEAVLRAPEILERILRSETQEVWIDIKRGKAPAEIPAAKSQDAESADLTAPASLEQEVRRAREICDRAKHAVVTMFSDAKMGRAMNVQDIDMMVQEISCSIQRHPHALISLSRLKTSDEYTYMHSVAVCGLMVALARHMGMSDDQVREAGVAGLMHDVGKMTVDPDILNKPGRLTPEEYQAMKHHPEAGLEILDKSLQANSVVKDVCLHHHEKFDGTGYPHALKGEEISIFARMGAVCDVYDAITSDRPYKKGWGAAHSIREMASWKGHFDDLVFQSFVKTVGIYPIGALVRLESGRLAVVIEQNEASLLLPKVKVFKSARTGRRFTAQVVDLADKAERDSITRIELPEDWDIADLDYLWGGRELRPGRTGAT